MVIVLSDNMDSFIVIQIFKLKVFFILFRSQITFKEN